MPCGEIHQKDVKLQAQGGGVAGGSGCCKIRSAVSDTVSVTSSHPVPRRAGSGVTELQVLHPVDAPKFSHVKLLQCSSSFMAL